MSFRSLLAVLVLFMSSGLVSAQTRHPEELLEVDGLADSKQFQRYWWEWSQRARPEMSIDGEARLQALRQVEMSRAAKGAISAGEWTPIGPRPILAGGIANSGRVPDVVADPTDADRWLIGAAQGGVWETTNAGVTWQPLTDDQASLAIGAIAFAPSNPLVVYAGTGESAFSSDAYGGAGVLKSTDGGATWTLQAEATFLDRSFSNLFVDPLDPDTLVASVSRGLVGSFSGSTSDPVGVFKSTDGGVVWDHVLTGDDGTDMVVDPTDFDRQYAGIGEIFGGAANGLYRSTDAGDTWDPVIGPWSSAGEGTGRVKMAIAPSDTDVMYVAIQGAFDGLGAEGALIGLWRTDDAWAATPSWTEINIGGASGICGSQCWYDLVLQVDSLDSSLLLAGGVALWRLVGAVWSNVSSPSGMHVDQHSLARAGSRLLAGNDGGVWSSADGGSTWSSHNQDLQLTQFYNGVIHPTDAELTIAGSQDNGTELWTGVDAWDRIFGGDGADNAISSLDPDNDWAVSFQGQQIQRTTNGGGSFTSAIGGMDLTGAPFIAEFKSCSWNPDIFIAGTDNLWRSETFFSGSASWVSNGPEETSGLSAMDFAPPELNCLIYAYGTRDGVLKLTGNGGGTWVDLDPAGMVPDRYITDIAFDRANANRMWVAVSGVGTGEGHLFETSNAFAPVPMWTDVSPPIDMPNNAIVVTVDGDLWVGTDVGVWTSDDGGASWTVMGPAQGLPNVAIYDLEYAPASGQMIAYTHGRGAFRLIPGLFSDAFESGDTTAWSSVIP